MPPPLPPRLPNGRPTESAADVAGRAQAPVRVSPPPLPSENSGLVLWIGLGTAIGVLIVVGGFVVFLLVSKTNVARDLVASQSEEANRSLTSRGEDDRSPLTEIENRSGTIEPLATGPTQRIEMDSKREGITGEEAPAATTSLRDQTSSPGGVTAIKSSTATDTATTAFADLRRRNFQMELPGRGQDLDLTETRLAMLPLPENETLQLALLGGAASNIKLVRQIDSPPETPAWNANKLADVGLGAQEEAVLGKFTHHSGELRFQWAEAPPWAKAGSLQFVPLEITIGATRQVCQLWKSITVNPIRIKTDGVSSGIVPLTANMIDRPTMFRVEFQLVETGKTERQSAIAPMGETAKILLGNDLVEMELKLVLGDGQSSVQARLYAEPMLMKKDITTKGPRQEITPTIIDEHLRQLKSKDPKKRESEIAKLQAQGEKLQKLIGHKAQQGDDQTALEKQAESINAKIAKLESELAGMQEAFNTNVEWYQAAAGILQKLGDQTQLCYAVYTATEPRTVVIETTGFDRSKK